MITSITLENFKSFGERQTVPLQPITVLVGPNNSGKSCFISIGEFITDRFELRTNSSPFLTHRPPQGDGEINVYWSDGDTSPQAWIDLRATGRSTALPFLKSRVVKLSIDALRSDAPVTPDPKLEPSGANLPAVLGLWRGFDPDRAQRLDEFIRKCLPEIKRVLVAPEQGKQRLWVEQVDGEKFDVHHVSDGVLFFIGLAMNIIDVEPGAILFIEEPEQSLHPRRLFDIVEQLRRSVAEFGCQFVIATHSPVLLNAFRDEPEAIVLFRRGEHGTVVKSLADVPLLVDALRKADPGDLLANGFFNDAF